MLWENRDSSRNREDQDESHLDAHLYQKGYFSHSGSSSSLHKWKLELVLQSGPASLKISSNHHQDYSFFKSANCKKSSTLEQGEDEQEGHFDAHLRLCSTHLITVPSIVIYCSPSIVDDSPSIVKTHLMTVYLLSLHII
jgi:hypothetical protein